MNRREFDQLQKEYEDVPQAYRLTWLQERIEQIKNPEDRQFVQFMFINGFSQVHTNKKNIIVLIHGINTHAVWQERLADTLNNEENIEVFPIGYGYFDVIKFLIPVVTRQSPINKVTRELRALKTKYPDAHFSIVAHSFGTYIMSKILAEETDIQIHRMQLCGSIIPEKYRWDKVTSRITGVIINDAGTKDLWPVLATLASWGYGPSGTFGFKTIDVRDRFHDCGHSDFFTEEHMEKYWIPLLTDGQVVKSTWTSARPSPSWFVILLNLLPFKTLIFSVALFYIIRFFYIQY